MACAIRASVHDVEVEKIETNRTETDKDTAKFWRLEKKGRAVTELILELISSLTAMAAAACWFKASVAYVAAPADSAGVGALLGGGLVGEIKGKRVDLIETSQAQSKWNSTAACLAGIAALCAAISFFFSFVSGIF